VQYSKSAIKVIAIITATMLTAPALAQSGRGRPRIPQPSPNSSQPPAVINVPAATAVTRQEQAGTTSRFVLRNGITVIVSEHLSTPIAAAVARFKASALDEPWSMSAAARLVQRLILKGTVLRPADQAITDLRALGASFGASTSYDGAAYSVIAPSDKLKDALAIQADMLQNAALDAQSMRREIQLLIEEEKRGGTPIDGGPTFHSRAFSTRTFPSDSSDQAFSRLDEPATFSMARLFNIAFTGGPPMNTDALRSLTREQLLEFYRSHYRPDNLVISIAGDVSTFNTLVEIQQLYGNFGASPAKPAEPKIKVPEVSKRKATATQPPPPPSNISGQPAKPDPSTPEATMVKPWGTTDQARLRYAADRGEISQSIISAGFHVPGADSKDWPAIEVLTALAGQGRASRFGRSMVDGEMAANRIESNYLAYAGTGLFVVQMWSASGKDAREGTSIDKAESALFKELERLRRETVSEGDMVRAKAVLEKRFVDETALYIERARALARAEATGVGFRLALDYRARIRAVTAEDVQRVAAKYLTLANTSLHEYEPLSAAARTFDADTFATTVIAWAPGFGQPVDSATVRAADASSSLAPVAQSSDRSPERQAMLESVQPLPIKDFSTLNGPKAFVREDHSRQTVTVAILFQGGRLVEEAATSGTTELMLRSILYGTPRRTFTQVTQELEQLGAEVRIVVEPDFFGFTLSAMSRNADRALKLVRDMIEEPAFRDDDIRRARLGQIAEIRDARDSSFTRSRELLLQALFAGHPYSLPPHGREEVVAALTSEKLVEWYERAVKRQLPLAIIVGDTDGSALVSSQIAEGFKRRDVDAAIQVRTPRPGAAAEKAESRRREQTTLALGTPGPKAESGDLIAVQLFESAMNGEGGRLLRELRDKQSLISTAALNGESMFVAGVIAAYAAAPAENEQRVRAALLSEFERLARGGLTADEISSARRLAATSRIALLQSQQQHALIYARGIFYRQQAAEVDTFSEQVLKVSAEDIKRVAFAYFKAAAACAGVVRGAPQAPTTSQPKQN
jgi:predicted Zn-dependent peptidase